jgi:hypothetical protein
MASSERMNDNDPEFCNFIRSIPKEDNEEMTVMKASQICRVSMLYIGYQCIFNQLYVKD